MKLGHTGKTDRHHAGRSDGTGHQAAVSELIGAIVLTAVIVAGVSIVGVVLWSQPPPLKVPSLTALISNQSCRIGIYHDGGDVLDRQAFRIFVDGADQTANFQKKGATSPWTMWVNGDTLEYAPSTCPQTPQRVDIVSNDGTRAAVIATAFFGSYQPLGLTPTPTPPPPAPPVVADFTSNTTSGTAPLAVQFNDTSTGLPVSWSWSFGDGGISNVQNASYTYQTHGRYPVSLTVTNASGGSNTMIKTDYITATPSPSWYSCSWSYRKNITIQHSQVSGTQSNFPVLISLGSDPDLAAHARSDGYDILFTSSDGTTKLSHEIEKYASGALVAWVKVPTVTSSADTTIIMYYGYAGSPNQQDKNGVWDANYNAVWHLTEDPSGAAPQMLDSTSNAYHGTSAGTMTTSDQVTAKVNGGLDFDGSDDYLSTNYVQNGVTAYTIEAWIKTSTTSMQRVIVHDRGSGAGRSLTLSIGGTYPGGPGVAGGVGYGVDSDSIYIGRYSTTTVNNNNWHHLVGVWTAPAGTAIAPAQFSIYIDGTAAATTDATVGTAPLSPLTGLGGTLIGRHSPWNTYLLSIIDEVRISNTVRTADWIATEYNNQNSPSTFYSLGSQQQWTC